PRRESADRTQSGREPASGRTAGRASFWWVLTVGRNTGTSIAWISPPSACPSTPVGRCALRRGTERSLLCLPEQPLPSVDGGSKSSPAQGRFPVNGPGAPLSCVGAERFDALSTHCAHPQFSLPQCSLPPRSQRSTVRSTSWRDRRRQERSVP